MEKRTKVEIDPIKVVGLIQKLTEFYGISADDLKKRSMGKGGGLSKVRAFIWYRMVKEWRYSINDAAQLFNKSYWAVHGALERMDTTQEMMNEYHNVLGKDET